ncbi:hypothetical protein [Algibacter mikhailovii]|uniref:Uncharacterized protein n=1 Tax=Algibacter mikhailovii TaxID=425498 RepID=A0A918QYN0_9FLAO|nr:hypothetical protein [Algibacter mikhailovii]GGZ76165.1 hypothetical protein GCM10007028_12160 [Algibacter mikhailovii]
MKQNPIENWISTDKRLNELIIEIELTDKTLTEKAEMVFDKLSELYEIPRMPTDVLEDEFDDDFDGVTDQRSLFEEHALIKYLADENEDPRGMVLSAAFHLLNDYRVDLFQVAEKEFGKNIPEKCKIGIKGEGHNGEVVFPQNESISWFDLGCKIMKQIN